MADTLSDVKYQVAVANRVLGAVGLATGATPRAISSKDRPGQRSASK